MNILQIEDQTDTVTNAISFISHILHKKQVSYSVLSCTKFSSSFYHQHLVSLNNYRAIVGSTRGDHFNSTIGEFLGWRLVTI